MPLPINKQPVVRPGSKLMAFGWPYHGLVLEAFGIGSMPLDFPASPAFKTFPTLTHVVIDNTSVSRWYIGWNCTNTTMIKRPGWPDPVRSVEEQALDDAKGYRWKPHMTFVGPQNRMSGTDDIPLGWNKYVYIDSLGAAYLISYTTLVTVAGNPYTVRFRFRIAELVLTVTRNPVEREVDFFFVVSGSSTDFLKTAIADRSNDGSRLLLHMVLTGLGLFWDLANDLPRTSNGGGLLTAVNEFTASEGWEILTTGDGIDNIAFTVTADPRDEATASFSFTPFPTSVQSQIRGWFIDGAGARQPITETITLTVSNLGVIIPATDHAYQWTLTKLYERDWGGLYLETYTEVTAQTAIFDPPNPFFVSRTQEINGDEVDADTASGADAVNSTYYDVGDDAFAAIGGGSPAVTFSVFTFPWMNANGERISRIALGYLSDSDIPASGVVLYDNWLDKKNGTIVPSASGWTGSGAPGFYEFLAYEPDTGNNDSVVYGAASLPLYPAVFDVNYYV